MADDVLLVLTVFTVLTVLTVSTVFTVLTVFTVFTMIYPEKETEPIISNMSSVKTLIRSLLKEAGRGME